MIIADTSVWIDYFNGVQAPTTDKLDAALYEQRVAMADLILLEVLQGFGHDKDYKRARDTLQHLPLCNLLNGKIALKAAEYFRFLRKRGITIRKTADVIIATYCIEHNVPLMFTDRDFTPFTTHLGLIAV